MVIVLGTAHRMREPGKRSPDGRLRECVYSREIVAGVKDKLKEYGYRVVVDYEPLDLPESMQRPSSKAERNLELSMRVNKVNDVCRQYGAKNVLYVSIHNNAAGSDGQWHSANGWCVLVSKNSSFNSKLLAECLFDSAKVRGIKTRMPMHNQKYWFQNVYVLTKTLCPAVLTENLFQDNKEDVDYLLSDEGKRDIIRLHVDGIVNYIERL